jgi:hypothetical protein
MTTVSELKEFAEKGQLTFEPPGRWCNLPPEYHFCYPHCDEHMTFYGDGWGTAKDADGEYFCGHDYHGHSTRAEIFVRVNLRRDGTPDRGRIAKNLTHEWIHHLLTVWGDPVASATFDNVNVARKARL